MSAPRGLLDASRFDVPSAVLDETVEALREAGRDGLEAMVTWAGRRQGDIVAVTRTIVPRQTSYRTADGLLVLVDGDALFALNRDLYSRGELLVAQVHSHGEDAYHSDTDDHLSLVTLLGALSVVVPTFAKDGRSGFADWYWTRLVGTGEWHPVEAGEMVRIS
jgi:hypothetical protein